MKKIFLSLLIVVLLLGGGTAVWGYVTYTQTGLESVPAFSIVVGEKQPLSANEYNWSTAIFNGIIYRDFSLTATDEYENEPFDLGSYEGDRIPVSPALLFTKTNGVNGREDVVDKLEVLDSTDKLLFEDSLLEYQSFIFPENGDYKLKVTLQIPKKERNSHGSFTYQMIGSINRPPPPPPPVQLLTGNQSVVQGDVLPIRLENVPDGVIPTIKTELGIVSFTKAEDGIYNAYLPVKDSREVGSYPVAVSCGEFMRDFTVTVTAGKFERQELWIDVSNPVISEASSPKAYQQYRESIYPLYETADDENYWNGDFALPVVGGRQTTQYGLLRYTNGNTKPSRHAGIDLALPTGTPIYAPANGRVAFAQNLLNTGNTLVIEHGGGLKTYYYHLEQLDVIVDEMVELGQVVGQIGSTGYSTGPHLHFETRIGAENINPWLLIEKTGGFYSPVTKLVE